MNNQSKPPESKQLSLLAWNQIISDEAKGCFLKNMQDRQAGKL